MLSEKMVDFCIDEVYPKGQSYPLIAHFQNGYPAECFTEQECEILEHKKSGKKCIASEINNILYVGDECEEPLGKTLMLVRNRKTGKVRLIEVGNVELQPLMKSVVEAPELETSYVELGRKFGSKKHKKQIEQKEKMKVSEDVVLEQLQDVSHNITADQLDLSSFNKTSSEDFYIPLVNREANTLEDVYLLRAILTQEQFENIFNEMEITEYKKNLFPCVKEVFSEQLSKEKKVLALYASTLLTINSKTMKEMSTKKFVACPYSATLDKVIFDEFFTRNGNHRQRPLQYKDKAMCHAIVFLFLINNYKIDLESLCKHTKLVEKTVTTKIHMTGGWITKQGTQKFAVLKLPLNKATGAYSRRKSTKF